MKYVNDPETQGWQLLLSCFDGRMNLLVCANELKMEQYYPLGHEISDAQLKLLSDGQREKVAVWKTASSKDSPEGVKTLTESLRNNLWIYIQNVRMTGCPKSPADCKKAGRNLPISVKEWNEQSRILISNYQAHCLFTQPMFRYFFSEFDLFLEEIAEFEENTWGVKGNLEDEKILFQFDERIKKTENFISEVWQNPQKWFEGNAPKQIGVYNTVNWRMLNQICREPTKMEVIKFVEETKKHFTEMSSKDTPDSLEITTNSFLGLWITLSSNKKQKLD